MPKLPSIDSIQRSTPKVNTSVASYRGGIAEAAEIETGTVRRQLGDQLHQFAQKELDDINKTVAQDALNKLQEKQLSLRMDPKSGYLNVTGGKALDGSIWESYDRTLQSHTDEIASGLNRAQLAMFRPLAENTNLNARKDIMQHRMTETENHKKKVFDSTISLAATTAAQSYANPDRVGASTMTALKALQDRAESQEWSDEQYAVEKTNLLSTIGTGVISSALAGNDLAAAKKYYDGFASSLTPEMKLKYGTHIETEQRRLTVQGAVSATISEYNKSAVTTPKEKYLYSLIDSTIAAESGGQGQWAADGQPLTSPAGAVGVMQVMPQYAEEFAKRAGVPWKPELFHARKSDDAAKNAEVEAYNKQLGEAQLLFLADRYQSDVRKASAAYNAGAGRVDFAIKFSEELAKTRSVEETVANLTKDANKDWEKSALQNMADVARTKNTSTISWAAFMPEETRRYIEKTVDQYQTYEKPEMTEADVVAYAISQLPADEDPRTVSAVQEKVRAEYKLIRADRAQQAAQVEEEIWGMFETARKQGQVFTADDVPTDMWGKVPDKRKHGLRSELEAEMKGTGKSAAATKEMVALQFEKGIYKTQADVPLEHWYSMGQTGRNSIRATIKRREREQESVKVTAVSQQLAKGVRLSEIDTSGIAWDSYQKLAKEDKQQATLALNAKVNNMVVAARNGAEITVDELADLPYQQYNVVTKAMREAATTVSDKAKLDALAFVKSSAIGSMDELIAAKPELYGAMKQPALDYIERAIARNQKNAKVQMVKSLRDRILKGEVKDVTDIPVEELAAMRGDNIGVILSGLKESAKSQHRQVMNGAIALVAAGQQVGQLPAAMADALEPKELLYLRKLQNAKVMESRTKDYESIMATLYQTPRVVHPEQLGLNLADYPTTQRNNMLKQMEVNAKQESEAKLEAYMSGVDTGAVDPANLPDVLSNLAVPEQKKFIAYAKQMSSVHQAALKADPDTATNYLTLLVDTPKLRQYNAAQIQALKAELPVDWYEKVESRWISLHQDNQMTVTLPMSQVNQRLASLGIAKDDEEYIRIVESVQDMAQSLADFTKVEPNPTQILEMVAMQATSYDPGGLSFSKPGYELTQEQKFAMVPDDFKSRYSNDVPPEVIIRDYVDTEMRKQRGY